MKIKLDIDCTPQEARAFFGLPDVAPMQEEVLRQMQAQILQNVRKMDPEAFLRTWFPITSQGFDDLRKAFTSAGGRSRRKGASEE